MPAPTRKPEPRRTPSSAARRFGMIAFAIIISIISVVNQVLTAIAFFRMAHTNMTPLIVVCGACVLLVILGISLYLALAVPTAATHPAIDRFYRSFRVV